jgi:hypothetical protein
MKSKQRAQIIDMLKETARKVGMKTLALEKMIAFSSADYEMIMKDIIDSLFASRRKKNRSMRNEPPLLYGAMILAKDAARNGHKQPSRLLSDSLRRRCRYDIKKGNEVNWLRGALFDLERMQKWQNSKTPE